MNIEEALTSQALLAYAMNGEPLPIQHGQPLRLIVPGWYALASVKWLSRLENIDAVHLRRVPRPRATENAAAKP